MVGIQDKFLAAPYRLYGYRVIHQLPAVGTAVIAQRRRPFRAVSSPVVFPQEVDEMTNDQSVKDTAVGDEVCFTHQLLQEYFVGRAVARLGLPG